MLPLWVAICKKIERLMPVWTGTGLEMLVLLFLIQFLKVNDKFVKIVRIVMWEKFSKKVFGTSEANKYYWKYNLQGILISMYSCK